VYLPPAAAATTFEIHREVHEEALQISILDLAEIRLVEQAQHCEVDLGMAMAPADRASKF